MLIVIPVPSSSLPSVSDFSSAIQKFGPYPNHQALFVSRPAETEQVKLLMDQISGLFDKYDLYVLKQEGGLDPSHEPNLFWGEVCHHLQFERGNTLPWFWLGLDSTPLKARWLDSIETEYNLAKMPFLGPFKSDEEGEYLAGTAVYPANIDGLSILYSYASKIPTPFDVLCRWEFTPRAHKSQLLQFAGESDSSNVVLLIGRIEEAVAGTVSDGVMSGTDDKPAESQLDAEILMPRKKRTRSAA
jgi:hypothetical protein